MTPEGKVKVWVKAKLKEELPGALVFSPLGGPFGKAGEPDIHVTYGGCKGVIEAKAFGENPTPLQKKRLLDYSNAGALAMVLRGKDHVKLALFVRFMKERAKCLESLIQQQNQ